MKSFKLLMIAIFSVVLLGCNTVSGFGKDVQSAGEVITHSVDKNDSSNK